MKLNSRNIIFTVFLIAVATITKIICAPNLSLSGFSPIVAIALFSGMIVKDKEASFLLPLLALIVSDVIIQVLYKIGLFDFAGFYKYQYINYALILLTTLIGWALQGKKLGSIFAGSIIAPTLFFLLSNLSVWYFSTHTLYSNDFKGLMACYTAALPFYARALTATIIFLPLILGAYNYIVKAKPRLTLA
jgi:hypothetical protein